MSCCFLSFYVLWCRLLFLACIRCVSHRRAQNPAVTTSSDNPQRQDTTRAYKIRQKSWHRAADGRCNLAGADVPIIQCSIRRPQPLPGAVGGAAVSAAVCHACTCMPANCSATEHHLNGAASPHCRRHQPKTAQVVRTSSSRMPASKSRVLWTCCVCCCVTSTA